MPRNGSGVYSAPAGTLATTLTTIKSPEYNAFVNDLVTDANAARPIVAGGTGATSAAGARANLGLTTGTFGFLYGLTLSNNGSDATNDIDIATGTSAEQDVSNPSLITLASALTKRLDAAWAVGTNQGGLDTGSIANTTYHVWLIQRSDTGVVDALFSTSATAPTMPTNYDRKRCIGSIMRVSGAIRAFIQDGDDVWWMDSPAQDFNVNNPGTSGVLRTIGVPTGRAFLAVVDIRLANNDTGLTVTGYISSPRVTDEAVSTNNVNTGLAGLVTASVVVSVSVSQMRILTNTSSQIRTRVNVSNTNLTITGTCRGYRDTRGRI